MLSHRIISTPGPVYTQHVAVFEYPDCTRTYDGRVWTVTPKQ